MIAIKHHFSVSKSWFVHLAESFSKATGTQVIVSNNKLIFPPTLASGRFEFYELSEGISVALIDCVFLKKMKIYREAVEGNENYRIIFNISKTPFVINKHSGRVVVSDNLAEAVFFSSHTTEGSISLDVNQRMQNVHVIFHRSWGVQHLLQNVIPLGITRLQQFANCMPMQFTTNLDIKSCELAKKMLSLNVPDFIMPRLLEGYVYQLVALFFNNVVIQEMGEKYVTSKDAMRIIQMKEHIEKNLENPLPTMEEAAAECLMSRSTFAIMFKTVFKQNYGSFFLELKMKIAKELLKKGNSVTAAGHKTGFSNIGHFAKVFKEHFGDTPGAFQRNSA
jgi:AraC-like DNA-binding protein